MLGSTNPKELAEFYEELVGKKPDFSEDGWNGWQIGSAFLMIGEHSEATGKSKEPFRIMLNLETKELEEEFNRLKEIKGAEVIKDPYDAGDGMMIATLADPDGNYIQLMPPWDGDKKSE